MNFFLGRLLGKHLCLFFGSVNHERFCHFLVRLSSCCLEIFFTPFPDSSNQGESPLVISLFVCGVFVCWGDLVLWSQAFGYTFHSSFLAFDLIVVKLIQPLKAFRYIRMMHTAEVYLLHPYLPSIWLPRRWNSQNAWKVQRRWTPGCNFDLGIFGCKHQSSIYFIPEKFPHLLWWFRSMICNPSCERHHAPLPSLRMGHMPGCLACETELQFVAWMRKGWEADTWRTGISHDRREVIKNAFLGSCFYL